MAESKTTKGEQIMAESKTTQERFEVPEIHLTTDYDLFKRIEGNRAVTARRSAKIMASIDKVGLIRCPIVVNEKMQVIDGQGRLEAVKALGLPVYYMVEPGLGIEDCIQMNITGTPWGLDDYIRSYAEIGNEDYQRLVTIIDGHSLPMSVCICAATGLMSTNSPAIKEGRLEFPREHFDDVSRMLAYIEGFIPVCKEHKIKNTNAVYMALCFAYQHEDVDNRRMADAFSRYWHKVGNSTSIETVCGFLSEVYNCGKKTGRVYLDTEYLKYMNGLYPWYASKWGRQEDE